MGREDLDVDPGMDPRRCAMTWWRQDWIDKSEQIAVMADHIEHLNEWIELLLEQPGVSEQLRREWREEQEED